MKIILKVFLVLALAAGISAAVIYFTSQGNASPPSVSESGTPERSEKSGLIINEVMSDNNGYYPADNGNKSDWAEFYNDTDSDISLLGYTLTDNINSGGKWSFPNVIIKARGYIVVFLTGDSKSDISNGIIHCSFKLSAGGESLYILAPSGRVADSVDLPALDPNLSYGRSDGAWKTFTSPTPGFENSDGGFSAYRQSMTVENPSVLITEVMPQNSMTIKDARGDYSDWVEIYNAGDTDLSLKGYGLSDNPNDVMKWRFSDISIKAGAYLTVYCNGTYSLEDADNEIYASFKLSSTAASVVLSDSRGKLMDSVHVSGLSSDWSYKRDIKDGKISGAWGASSQPSPGYSNDTDGFTQFIKNNPLAAGDLVISEALASNNKYINEGTAKYDYIEIENRGNGAINLSGYGLTNNAANPAKFRFPDRTLQPGQRIVVLAAGLSAAQSNSFSNLSAPFKLSRLGDTIALFDPADNLLDRYFLGVMPQNYSIGREAGKTELVYFAVPTPGAANGAGYAGITQEVQFDKQAGKYDGAIQLALSSSDGADIYYTTNGDTPTASSNKYEGALTVSNTAAVRAIAVRSGYIASGVATATYLIGTGHTLPVVSLVTDDKNLFDTDTGIYELGPNPGSKEDFYPTANFRSDTEVPASFEMYDESGKRVFSQDIGLAMTGGLTLALRDQKSFAIYARSNYGQSTMAYPFFENRDFTEYKSLILRVGSREGGPITKLHTYVALSLVDGKMNVVTQAARPCVVYINGKYWGIYYMMEKRNKYMVAQHEGITDPAAINSINLTKGLSKNLVSNGSYEGYADIYEYVNSHDLSVQENYDWVDARLDTDSYMDFMINEIYIANNDPGNMQYYQAPGGKWIQIYQDLDISFSSFDTVALRIKESTSGARIFNALLKNDGWRNSFIERFAWALKNIYSPDTVIAMIDKGADLIRGEIAAEHQRWSELPALDEWETSVKAMKSFAKNRGKTVVKDLKNNLSLTETQKKLLEDAIK